MADERMPGQSIALSTIAPEYLQAALDEMRKEFGTIEGYFADELNLDRRTADLYDGRD